MGKSYKEFRLSFLCGLETVVENKERRRGFGELVEMFFLLLLGQETTLFPFLIVKFKIALIECVYVKIPCCDK